MPQERDFKSFTAFADGPSVTPLIDTFPPANASMQAGASDHSGWSIR
jgi:hypothetical protein